ncbi:MAG: GDSL family lipase [Saprospiraceae bacterium]|nr:GDSL family lipase [Saprospiraceae bacterium]
MFALAFGKKETPVVFLAGDSTLAQKLPADAPETGWGMVFPDFFDNHAVQFQNHAVNGRSTKSFRSLGHWDNMMARVRPGDYVFLQFGHNDSKQDDSTRYAPAQTAYRDNLSRFIAEIRAKGAQPVLLTPVVRRNFDENGHFVDKHGDYPAVVRTLAAAQNIPLIDLWAKSKALLEKLGPVASKALFMNLRGGIYPKYPEDKTDNTHFTPYGAGLVAALVAEGVQESGLALQYFLKKSIFPEKYAYELPQINEPAFRKDTFNILDFGARAGGIFLNTQALAAAIDTCHQRGGGLVLIPPGLWLTGPIRLRSHVNLHLQQGALLQFTDDLAQYPLLRTNWEGLDAIRNHSPIYGTDLEDVGITGRGIIDGAGMAWRPLKKDKVTASEWNKLVVSGGVLNATQDTWYPTAGALKGAQATRPGVVAEGYDEAKALEIKEFLRPNLLNLVRCTRVLIDGPTFQNSPAWTLHPLLCTHFTLRNVTVKNPAFAQNGDGVDLESTRFFRVENCVFDTGDDGICLKSGRNEEGRKRGVPTSDGIVEGCTVYKAHGGFVVGSEMSGGVRNIFVSHCTFLGSDIGLRFKTTRGRGGVVEDIFISDINMTDIPAEAILFDMYYNGKEAAEALKNPEMEKLPVTEATPVFRRIYIQNVACRGAAHAIYIQGLPEMNVQDIRIRNSVFHTRRGLSCVEGDGIRLQNVTLNTTTPDPAIFVLNSRNLLLDSLLIGGKAAKALHIEGKQSGSIRVLHTDIQTLGIQYGAQVPTGILTQD